MSSVTLAQASTIVDAALAKARELSLAPMTVVVLDAGGHMVALKREDGSGILRVEIDLTPVGNQTEIAILETVVGGPAIPASSNQSFR